MPSAVKKEFRSHRGGTRELGLGKESGSPLRKWLFKWHVMGGWCLPSLLREQAWENVPGRKKGMYQGSQRKVTERKRKPVVVGGYGDLR